MYPEPALTTSGCVFRSAAAVPVLDQSCGARACVAEIRAAQWPGSELDQKYLLSADSFLAPTRHPAQGPCVCPGGCTPSCHPCLLFSHPPTTRCAVSPLHSGAQLAGLQNEAPSAANASAGSPLQHPKPPCLPRGMPGSNDACLPHIAGTNPRALQPQ